MRTQIVSKNLLFVLILTSLFALSMLQIGETGAVPAVSMSAATNKSSYYIREPATLAGTINESGQPAMDYLVGVEADNPRGGAIFYRTISIGNPAPAPPLTWQLQISAVYVEDSYGTETNSITLNSLMSLHATLKNNYPQEYNVVVTGTVFDGDLIPIIAVGSQIAMAPSQTRTVSWSVPVPEWAYSGEALATVNVYTDFPRNNGTSVVPEARYVFYLTRNSAIKTPYSVLPATDASAPGQYQLAFRMPPDIYTQPGTYNAYVTTVSPATPYLRSLATTSFSLLQYPSPPQAAFTYTPLQIYGGVPVTFDASSSSAEGPNVTITQYEWTINDPNNPVHTIQTSPTLIHNFTASGTYVAQLNVTNSVGLWSTTSKPVVVLPDYGPTANFTWTPQKPTMNHTAIFNASSSQLGWSTQIVGFAPIANYTWNFGDSTPINVTTNSTIQHVFVQMGNYTVTLTITDIVSRTNATSQLVQVINRTLWDLDGDGKKTDITDVAIAAKAFGTHPGSPLWNPIADITGPNGLPDGKVDITDVALVARHFGQAE